MLSDDKPEKAPRTISADHPTHAERLPPRQGKVSSMRRDRILATAMDLFSRKGYARTSIREITEAAGVTRPLLYYYFRNKEGIYQESVGSYERQLERLLEAVKQSAGSPKEKIEQLCLGLWLQMQGHTQLRRVIWEDDLGPYPDPFSIAIPTIRGRIETFLYALVEEGLRLGVFRSCQTEDAVGLFLGLICSTETREITREERCRRLAVFERSLQLAFDGTSRRRLQSPEGE